ncbi:hypothetical protein [Halorhabdus sp. SVX81]|uniref:DUF7521 family protein n=1 Tax=Halorhabdus sp. SVX81 TaxID=2978283 RepID=UPI0023DB9A19|nr:hypothetical protein [Halorhabdus sp. SVX81]
MSPHASITVIALKTLILLLGGLITFLAYRAYRRTRSQSLGSLALGFGVITLGAFLAGAGNQIFSLGLEASVMLESGLTAGGFIVIVYSLYAAE